MMPLMTPTASSGDAKKAAPEPQRVEDKLKQLFSREGQETRKINVLSERRALHDQILAAIVPECCFASVRLAGEVAACGLGVVQDGYIGLYDIITDLRFRQRGYGNSLVCSLLGWGVSRNARWAYLQVMQENLVAQRLYRRIGFKEIYQYWYRVLK